MEPTTTVCNGACTITHVVSMELHPFSLSMEQGGAIAGAVIAVWVVGWAFRWVIRTLRDTDGKTSSTNESD